jgi:hypothetical protein
MFGAHISRLYTLTSKTRGILPHRICFKPQCAGAIDGCFIPIVRPEGEFAHKYWCYKGMDAIILLAVVDVRGLFTYK